MEQSLLMARYDPQCKGICLNYMYLVISWKYINISKSFVVVNSALKMTQINLIQDVLYWSHIHVSQQELQGISWAFLC